MYRAPVKDIRFVLDELIGSDELRACPEFAEYSSETADAVLGEAARFAETVLEPLCKSGDRKGARWAAAAPTRRVRTRPCGPGASRSWGSATGCS